MGDSEKINGKKKLPSIPSNYVTLLQLQERWVKEKGRKQNEKEEREEPQQEQEEKETQADERANGEFDGRRSRKIRHFPQYDRENGKSVVKWKPKDEEIAAGFAVKEIEDVREEKKGEELKNEKKKKKKNNKWRKNKKNKKEEKAEADNEGEKVVGPAVNPPLPPSTESSKVEKEVITDEAHAPKLATVEEETIEARREFKPRIVPRTNGRTVEIERKFRAMSVKGETRTWNHCRQYGNFNHSGGTRELNRRYNGKFDRRRELNQGKEGMVWVKKGEVSDGNVSGIQSSISQSKESD
ncbi:hypothetical protein DITRI_Ditri10aG0054200 [Diplodiscus trichospermus]